MTFLDFPKIIKIG